MLSSAREISLIVCELIAAYALHSTVLIGALWLLTRVLRLRSHALAEQLWKLALILPVFSALVDVSGWSAPMFEICLAKVAPTEPSAEAKGSEPPAAAAPEPNWSAHAQRRPERFGRLAEVAAGHVDPPPGQGFSPHGRSPQKQTSRPPRMLPTGPLIAPVPRVARPADHEPAPASAERAPLADATADLPALLMTLAVLIGLGRFAWLVCRKRKRDLKVMGTGAADLILQQLLAHNRVRKRVQLLVCRNCSEPIAYGLVRWTIVLPVDIESRLKADELRALLAHELAHLCRGDVWWLWIGRLWSSVFWFQPLNQLARRNWQAAAEFLCDEWAVASGSSPLSMARCLAQMAEWKLGRPAVSASLPARGTKSALISRVERLTGDRSLTDQWARPARRRLTVCAAAGLGIGAGMLAPSFSIAQPDPPTLRGATTSTRQVPQITSSDPQTSPPVRSPSRHQPAELPMTSGLDRALSPAWQDLQQQLHRLDADLERAESLLTQLTGNEELQTVQQLLIQRRAALQEQQTALFDRLRQRDDLHARHSPGNLPVSIPNRPAPGPQAPGIPQAPDPTQATRR